MNERIVRNSIEWHIHFDFERKRSLCNLCYGTYSTKLNAYYMNSICLYLIEIMIFTVANLEEKWFFLSNIWYWLKILTDLIEMKDVHNSNRFDKHTRELGRVQTEWQKLLWSEFLACMIRTLFELNFFFIEIAFGCFFT